MPSRRWLVRITARTATAEGWIGKVEAQAAAYSNQAAESAWTAHQQWWNQFWDRSWIFIDAKPGDDAFAVASGYALQNWITLDRGFLNTSLLPFAKQITSFYDNRYPRDDEGKLVISPGNALEEVWACTNPAPEIAGLRFILPQLLELASRPEEQQGYARLLKTIPELPRAVGDEGREYLLPAATGKRRSNCEKPECYAIFPYRLFGVGLPELELARETFRLSPKSMNGQPRSNGWVQDAIFAACVGEVEEAERMLVERSKLHDKNSRFPAFWGPNFDWTPDQDHGGVNMIALQQMLVQTEPASEKIHLCPAWPNKWDCSFKLHAPGPTIIQGKVKAGKVVDLIVTPEARRKDIVIHSKGTILKSAG